MDTEHRPSHFAGEADLRANDQKPVGADGNDEGIFSKESPECSQVSPGLPGGFRFGHTENWNTTPGEGRYVWTYIDYLIWRPIFHR